MVYHDNKPLLIDFDGIGFGRSEYDFIPSYVNSEVKKEPAIKHGFIEGYGKDIDNWSYLEPSMLIKKMSMTTWVGSVSGKDEKRKREFEKRVDSLITGVVNEPWLNF